MGLLDGVVTLDSQCHKIAQLGLERLKQLFDPVKARWLPGLGPKSFSTPQTVVQCQLQREWHVDEAGTGRRKGASWHAPLGATDDRIVLCITLGHAGIDQPIDQGMVGFGFRRDLPDLSSWARLVSDAIEEGIKLLDEVGQSAAPNLAAEVAEMKGRLAALEARLAPEAVAPESSGAQARGRPRQGRR